MIKLEVADYCRNCPDFDCVSETLTDDIGDITFTTIRCKYERRCENIYKYLKHTELDEEQK